MKINDVTGYLDINELIDNEAIRLKDKQMILKKVNRKHYDKENNSLAPIAVQTLLLNYKNHNTNDFMEKWQIEMIELFRFGAIQKIWRNSFTEYFDDLVFDKDWSNLYLFTLEAYESMQLTKPAATKLLEIIKKRLTLTERLGVYSIRFFKFMTN